MMLPTATSINHEFLSSAASFNVSTSAGLMTALSLDLKELLGCAKVHRKEQLS